MRIKIEINTHERSPALPLTTRIHHVQSAWWTGETEVLTFQPTELVATKIRALYQRSKGRDLFDLWLALDHLQLQPEAILAAFEPYRPDGLTAAKAAANLTKKLSDTVFRTDLDPLVPAWPTGYTIESAAELVTEQLLDQLDN